MINWTHADEQLCKSIAEYCSKHPCTKNYGADSNCIKGLDNPLFDKLRTVQECYECNRKWMEQWKQEQENENEPTR